MKTILIVEDTKELRDLFVEVLSGAGYRAVAAEHGPAALDILASMGTEPCLVLLDLTKPVVDGRTFIDAVHEAHHVAALPIVIVSAVVTRKDLPAARTIVRKPVSSETLLRLVADFCGPPGRP